MLPEAGPRLSVAVPSLGRRRVLWDMLAGLLPQLAEGDELLLVDQNSPPLDLPGSLRRPGLTRLPLQPPGLTRARNEAIARSRNPYVLFLDDDIVPAPDLLACFREAVRRDGNCVWAGAVDQNDLPRLEGVGYADLRTGEIRTRFDFRGEGELAFFPGGHALLPKACLPPPPWFHPAFRGSAQGEEIDLALRLRARGVRIRALPKARIRHLKIEVGGCRHGTYRVRFFQDDCHNQAFFFARHGRLLFLPAFLGRLRGLLEFHSRRQGFPGHSPRLVLAGCLALAQGLLAGLRSRPRLIRERRKDPPGDCRAPGRRLP